MAHRHNIDRHLRLRAKDVAEMPTDEVAALVHELQVNQIALNLQNEELRRTERELAESRDYLAELFDDAPVAYLTTNPGGMVKDVNRVRIATLS
ncbi:MAG TPA: hypothetical protein VFB62_04310 [Polyangiaceae bacterium]|jgi:PAS domain-containing protein|nr:hypothetical protein [Polyangiaceae bacterium]